MVESVYCLIHYLSLVRIVALAGIRLNYFILIREYASVLIAFLSELFHFGIVCVLLLYRLKTFKCSKSYYSALTFLMQCLEIPDINA